MAKAALEQKAMTTVPQYLIDQNRPYSPIDIYNNLHQEFGKTLIVKALEAAVTGGKIKEKAVGKQKIYYANQENFENSDDSALGEYDVKIGELSETVSHLNNEHKELDKELKTLIADETTENLKFTLQIMTNRSKAMEERCATLEAGRNTDVESEGKQLAVKESTINKVLKTRKRLASDMFNSIRENSMLTKKALVESLGIEVEKDEI
ncbi:hypothetical protein WR25_18978 [Diploscapter pachys]|uniref:Homologous-pairing protein 2 winged helix domain-containing protein n=1 Tax=Diploscapter pachys TaxID=2018661 RepID=A0A2A2M056_9BILA|nr:hypothetical protein WR25_18978 [Diploscapter pachys]